MITKYFIPSLDVSNDKEAIEELGNILVKNGDVAQEYITAVIAAEKNLPTAIDVGNMSVAIPHADEDGYINKAAVAIGLLKRPVSFGSMIVSCETIPVNIVFLLAVKGINEQLMIVSGLMKALQKEKWLDKFCRASSKEEMQQIFNFVWQEDNEVY